MVIQNGMSYKKKFDTWREENTKGLRVLIDKKETKGKKTQRKTQNGWFLNLTHQSGWHSFLSENEGSNSNWNLLSVIETIFQWHMTIIFIILIPNGPH